MSNAIIKVAILIYDFALLAGAAYMVQVYDWSMWTFLLAAIFFMTSKTNENSIQ